jgi:nucleoside-diphosphate-sugar epimerase
MTFARFRGRRKARDILLNLGNNSVNILIVGAAGNLGSFLTKHLLSSSHHLRLLTHKRTLSFDLPRDANAEIVRGDLNDPASLKPVCDDIDCIVYLAGVLFQPHPEKFLHRTNTVYAQNLVDTALAAGVRKFILISFPHVEENTTPDAPAKGELNTEPKSLHARTRLAAEKYMFHACEKRPMTPIVLRAGVIYGRNVKLIEATLWLMRWRLMAIWRAPTWVHLLALPDFLNIVRVAIEKENLSGIYNVCDDQPLLLQEFLDRLARHWGYRPPRRLPEYFFHAAAAICEAIATICCTGTPLTRDMIVMGMTSVVADTSRMKSEIVGQLQYPTLRQGIAIL